MRNYNDVCIRVLAYPYNILGTSPSMMFLSSYFADVVNFQLPAMRLWVFGSHAS